ncbi:hypothetical protein GDO78_016515 [Eleutherodactylus coqui]|uniref:Pseudouridine synthase II N-terminal domain-containing protein n=1 Tax=Eleutherodactylus coqui TaxID=57060 RepID=A0A8J6JZJ8_ELECQ|nr:hypothetical protein GDO78_016515 [Eleutherodactylus coqui]
MALSAASAFRALHGIFAVYKPPAVHWKSVRDTIEMKLLRELNSLKQPAPRQKILFLPQSHESSSGVEITKVVTSVPALLDHILVRGPSFTHLKVGVGHKLDMKSSGVFVIGIGNDHITRDRLERVLAMIQGTNQKALIMHSRMDLKSQEAYEMAVQGNLRPMEKSPPLLLGVRCVEFSPPNFTLEIRCMHETQQYLRKLIHEIGLELRSSAVCTKVRRTRDGPFTLECALTHGHWDLNSITNAVRECSAIATELRKDDANLIWEKRPNEDSLDNEGRSLH